MNRVKLNGIFKDNMVFQWGTEVRVFGKAEEPCYICVQIIKDEELVDEVQVQTADDNTFIAGLKPIAKPDGPFEFRIYSFADGESEWSVEDIISECYAGEVWLASGQSNMEYPLVRSEYAKYELEKTPRTEIHFYNVPMAGAMDEAQQNAEEDSAWVVIDSETARDMSGVAFFFARSLEERIDSKIGIIGCYVGGTSISCWLSLDKLTSTPEGKKFKSDFDRQAAILTDDEYDGLVRDYEKRVNEYNLRLNAILSVNPYTTYSVADEKLGAFVWQAPVSYKAPIHPGAMFECMIKRIAPFNIRGVIFYQGETDCGDHAGLYGPVFASLIEEWREVFVNPDMPFIFCQLPMYISKERKFMDYDDMAWPKLREQQENVAKSVKNTYMTVIADCGEFDNIHPSDKKTPGRRMAAMALKYVYGYSDIPAKAPYIIDARRGDGVEVTFGGDFLLLNLITGFDSDETGFEIAGEDGEFYRAGASVDFDGKTVILTCPRVEFPVKVRYGYFSYGVMPLYADNGLAAAPFSVTVEKELGGSKG